MSLFDSIEKLITEHGSAAILKERIALACPLQNPPRLAAGSFTPNYDLITLFYKLIRRYLKCNREAQKRRARGPSFFV
jgi:hypothetical protein